MEKGIMVAGSSFVDHNKFIDYYPELSFLANILETQKVTGGCVNNTILSLRQIDEQLKLYAATGVGQDEDGKFIKETLISKNINIENIVIKEGMQTGFTDAMIINNTGERTFFTYEGANKIYNPDDINLENVNIDILHVGYIFLLSEFDKTDVEYGTKMARFLKNVQDSGIKTSIDLVSAKNESFEKTVSPSLKYTNYFIANEYESGKIVGIDPYADREDKISETKIRLILEGLFKKGVKDLAVIHAPMGGWAMDKYNNFYSVSSLKLPTGYIKSTVGAGDAFCAGMLYSLYKEFNVNKSLKLANIVAAMSMGEPDANSGILNYKYIEKFLLSIGNEDYYDY